MDEVHHVLDYGKHWQPGDTAQYLAAKQQHRVAGKAAPYQQAVCL